MNLKISLVLLWFLLSNFGSKFFFIADIQLYKCFKEQMVVREKCVEVCTQTVELKKFSPHWEADSWLGTLENPFLSWNP
jgi:hypothetical protein